MAFAPVYTRESRTLIVGTWPSPKSRAQGFYYGHPQNRFWPMLAKLLCAPAPGTIEEKIALLCANGLALWDTVEHCEITGASDASIRGATPTDIEGLCRIAPIRRVLCNGAAAYGLYTRFHAIEGVQAVRLPSTSPANAACSFARLCEEWGRYIGPGAAQP